MEQLTGPEWFERVYKRAGENKTDALTRLAVDSGLQIKTLYRVLNRKAVNARTCEALHALPDGDKLDLASLTVPSVDSADRRDADDEGEVGEPSRVA